MIAGIIEGFYGPPWSWADRAEVVQACAGWGMGTYVHAPKDDDLHRERWREPWSTDHLEGFGALAALPGVTVGVGLSPGLDVDHTSADDVAALVAKVDAAVDSGVELVVLCVDDIPVRPGLGAEHAELTCSLHDHLGGRATLALVPTEYTGTRATAYLDALAEGVPDEVPIGWTGTSVVNDVITFDEARARADALGGRLPLLWDNVPVNDALMADRLFLGPLRGRERHLPDALSGWLANPMVQPRASLLPLCSIAAFLRGEDPVAVWEAQAGDLLPLAQACDGLHAQTLVRNVVDDREGARADLRAWLDAVAACDPGSLAEEVGAWDQQAKAEARLGLAALDLLEAPTAALGLQVAATWPGIRRADRTVMGPRCSMRPVLGQDDAGEWVLHDGVVQHDQNAVDELVALALARAV